MINKNEVLISIKITLVNDEIKRNQTEKMKYLFRLKNSSEWR